MNERSKDRLVPLEEMILEAEQAVEVAEANLLKARQRLDVLMLAKRAIQITAVKAPPKRREQANTSELMASRVTAMRLALPRQGAPMRFADMMASVQKWVPGVNRHQLISALKSPMGRQHIESPRRGHYRLKNPRGE
jgi:hypothetical protein